MPYSASNHKHVHFQSVATTDATVTTIKTIPVKLNSVVYLTAIVTARRTGGTSGTIGDSAIYHIERGAKNNQGTVVTLGGADTVVNAVEDASGWACSFSESGGTMLLRVTGATANNITWNAKIEVIENI